MKVVVAGGGTAGHIEPALNVADAIRQRHPQAQIVALGTVRGLETSLVPSRGYQLELIEAVPLPRKPDASLFALPRKLRTAIKQCRQVLAGADALIGFGGYVALPAYLAARGRVPIIVHEANARAGLANRVGAKFATAVVETVAGSLPGARRIGIPLRANLANFDRTHLREQARAHFNLTAQTPVLLVFGGSQGAVKLNTVLQTCRDQGLLTNVQVIHAVGVKNPLPEADSQTYHALAYIDRMDLAYAAADFVIARSGAMTVAELSTVGLPACYVPLPIGNGEQRLNAQPVVAAGGALCIPDADFTAEYVAREILPILQHPDQLALMAKKTAELGNPDASAQIADLVDQVIAGSR